jgi:hypothetical protein
MKQHHPIFVHIAPQFEEHIPLNARKAETGPSQYRVLIAEKDDVNKCIVRMRKKTLVNDAVPVKIISKKKSLWVLAVTPILELREKWTADQVQINAALRERLHLGEQDTLAEQGDGREAGLPSSVYGPSATTDFHVRIQLKGKWYHKVWLAWKHTWYCPYAPHRFYCEPTAPVLGAVSLILSLMISQVFLESWWVVACVGGSVIFGWATLWSWASWQGERSTV